MAKYVQYPNFVITKGDIFNLNAEVDEIENELSFLDPTHWYESRRVDILENRLDEIFYMLTSDLAMTTTPLTLVSSTISSSSPSSVGINPAL